LRESFLVYWERQLCHNLRLAKMLNGKNLKSLKLKIRVATAKSPKLRGKTDGDRHPTPAGKRLPLRTNSAFSKRKSE
jgi:hypothetical protein